MARTKSIGSKDSTASNATTHRLAGMNLALRGIEADFGPEHADTLRRDLHPDLRADTATRVSAKPQPRSHSVGLLRSERQLLANPPFNASDTAMSGSARHNCEAYPQVVPGAKDRWSKDDDVRWQFGVPPKGNANFAWVQHFIHHLAPHGMAGFVLANGSMSSNQSGEGDIRRALIEADLVDCMVALPSQLFYSTQIPVCLWFCGKIARSIVRTTPVCSMAKRNSAW